MYAECVYMYVHVLLTYFLVVIREEVVKKGWGVCETLEHRVKEACVPHVGQTRAHTMRGGPFHYQLGGIK